MKKPYTKPPTIEEIRKEYNTLLIAKNPKAAELKKKIDYFDYGVKY